MLSDLWLAQANAGSWLHACLCVFKLDEYMTILCSGVVIVHNSKPDNSIVYCGPIRDSKYTTHIHCNKDNEGTYEELGSSSTALSRQSLSIAAETVR